MELSSSLARHQILCRPPEPLQQKATCWLSRARLDLAIASQGVPDEYVVFRFRLVAFEVALRASESGACLGLERALNRSPAGRCVAQGTSRASDGTDIIAFARKALSRAAASSSSQSEITRALGLLLAELLRFGHAAQDMEFTSW